MCYERELRVSIKHLHLLPQILNYNSKAFDYQDGFTLDLSLQVLKILTLTTPTVRDL